MSTNSAVAGMVAWRPVVLSTTVSVSRPPDPPPSTITVLTRTEMAGLFVISVIK